MADIKNVNRSGGNEIGSLTNNQIADRELPAVAKSDVRTAGTSLPAGKSSEARAPEPQVRTSTPSVSDAAGLRDAAQMDAAGRLSTLGGVSATDRLLGLDLRPTMTGLLTAPPGNLEFMRHLSPQARRTLMRKMLGKQRERMRRLARYLRDRRDETNGEDDDRESFLEVITEPGEIDRSQLGRATSELERAARMLNILDEMLAMQDYTISQIGTFSQG